MAHPIKVKARALAMLVMQERVTAVSRVVGVPKSTVGRWKVEADAIFLSVVQSSPKIRATVAEIRKALAELHRALKRD